MLWSGYDICDGKCYGLATISVMVSVMVGYDICDGKCYGLATISVMVSAMVWL